MRSSKLACCPPPRKCAEGLSQARGSTQTLEFLLDPLVEGEWEVLPRTGQVPHAAPSPHAALVTR